jgi:hypothetical protein
MPARRPIRTMADGWTIVTKDHSLSAQWEHTVLVTDTGYEVLTVSRPPPQPDWIRPVHRMILPIPTASLWSPACRSRLQSGQTELRERYLARKVMRHACCGALPTGRRSPLRPVAERWPCRRRWHWWRSVVTDAANSIPPPTSISCSCCRQAPDES